MNISLVMEIIELAWGLLNHALNPSQSAASVTSALLQILQKGAQAYEQHTGEALDPSLIHAEQTV